MREREDRIIWKKIPGAYLVKGEYRTDSISVVPSDGSIAIMLQFLDRRYLTLEIIPSDSNPHISVENQLRALGSFISGYEGYDDPTELKEYFRILNNLESHFPCDESHYHDEDEMGIFREISHVKLFNDYPQYRLEVYAGIPGIGQAELGHKMIFDNLDEMMDFGKYMQEMLDENEAHHVFSEDFGFDLVESQYESAVDWIEDLVQKIKLYESE